MAKSVKSCTVFAFQADGGEVLTVEGLAKDGELHPVQQAFTDCHGFQCGYCTPGFLMSTLQLLDEHPHPDRGRDSQRHRRQHLPLHRISEHFQGDSGRSRGRVEEIAVAIKFSGEFTTPRSPDEVFEFLSDPNKFGPLLPDFESMTLQDATHFTVKVRVGVGNIRGTAEIKMELAEATRSAACAIQGPGHRRG